MPLASGLSIPERQGSAALALPAGEAAPAARLFASRWLAWLIGLTVSAATLGLWAALLAQERAQLARAAAMQLESVRNEIAVRMESRMLAQLRMARRWEMQGEPPRAEWEADAAQYMRHYGGLLSFAWVDADFRVRWEVGASAPPGTGIDPRSAAVQLAWRSALGRGQIALSRVVARAPGENVFSVNVPIFGPSGFAGLIVATYSVQSLLDEILRRDIAHGYGIRVMENGATIYLRGATSDEGDPRFKQEAGIRLADTDWLVHVWPPPPALAAMRSSLPQAVLAGGLTLALLLAFAARLAQVARLRALETESANRDLQREIAERRRAQERLRKLSRAVEQSPTMVLITDASGAIEYVNPKFTQVTGYGLDEARGRNPRILKSGRTPPATYAQLWAKILAGAEWRGELCNRKKNGDIYLEHLAISPIRDERGAVTHFLAEAEDITERRRLQEEVAARNRERAENRALAAMGQAASMIAHDLRNPLSTIKMSLGILGKRADSPLTEAEHEINRIALEQVRYMEEVLSDLLSYARPDALQPAWIDLGKLLDASVVLAQREIEERGVRVETRYEPGLPTLHGDPNKLRQAFSNLILNAVQATEGVSNRAPEVVVCARMLLGPQPPQIRVEILDNGCGLPAELGERIFEPFCTSRARGTGLGLSIAKRIVDQHGGQLGLGAAPGGGTCAAVVLSTGPVRQAQ
ncbi:MAG: PAS domain S-box protein [Burkholderiales bacterium]|nr:PAS domain S-box protein [Burkholderiales bacterium]